ncbi:MAG: ComEC/Rec2 family competence protein [Bacteroidota bacterium]
MNPFLRYPFARILLPFLAGILVEIYAKNNSVYTFIAFIFFISLLFTDHFFIKLGKNYRYRVFNGMVFIASLFFAGTELTKFHNLQFRSDHFSLLADKNTPAIATITETPVQKEKSVKAEVKIEAVKQNGTWKKTSGKAIVYFEKNEDSKNLVYGDQVIFPSSFEEIDPPKNPGEFNYKQYLSFHCIYHRQYIKNQQWKKTGRGGHPLMALALDARDAMLDILKKSGLTGDEYAVAAALILGYRSDIDAGLVRAYSASGAMHVLSVSGLHVGLVYIVLNGLLKFLSRTQRQKISKAILLLLMLWFYAMLTGLSASVLRSAAMLSFVVVAEAINRNNNIYNTLAASAFVLLCFDPFMIMEVGFQLSYLAVIGIVYLQPKIYGWWYVRNYFSDKVWQITAVSIAAQLITFPLGLLYFHQFPNYFLFSNLIVIPVATIILYLGIAAIITYPVSAVSELMGKCIYWCVKFLNESVIYIERLPYSLLNGISITIAECWMIYIMLAGIMAYTELKKVKFIFVTLVTCLLFLVYQLYENILQHHQKKIIVYRVPGKTAIDLVDGKQHYFICDSSLYTDESKMLFHIRHNWFDMGVESETFFPVTEKGTIIKTANFYRNGNFIQFYNKRIAIIDEHFDYRKNRKTIQVDYLILRNNPKIYFEKLVKIFDFDVLVMDGSNAEWFVRRIKEKANTTEKENCGFLIVENGYWEKGI